MNFGADHPRQTPVSVLKERARERDAEKLVENMKTAVRLAQKLGHTIGMNDVLSFGDPSARLGMCLTCEALIEITRNSIKGKAISENCSARQS